MIALHLLSESIPPLRLEDTGEQAMIVMHEYNVNQLPVVDGASYAGLITMEDIINLKHLSKPLKHFSQSFRQPLVKDNAHVFDILKAAVEFNVRAIPVVNEEHKYLGLISAESCLRVFTALNSIKKPGGILELEVPLKNYSLSEIAKIAEDNEIEILCLYTNINQVTNQIEITLKLNTTEVSAIVAAFERYEYNVAAIYNDVEYSEDLKDRYDMLMRYLNV